MSTVLKMGLPIKRQYFSFAAVIIGHSLNSIGFDIEWGRPLDLRALYITHRNVITEIKRCVDCFREDVKPGNFASIASETEVVKLVDKIFYHAAHSSINIPDDVNVRLIIFLFICSACEIACTFVCSPYSKEAIFRTVRLLAEILLEFDDVLQSNGGWEAFYRQCRVTRRRLISGT